MDHTLLPQYQPKTKERKPIHNPSHMKSRRALAKIHIEDTETLAHIAECVFIRIKSQ